MTRTYWLSFLDRERPKGQRFLGACVVTVSEADIARAAQGLPEPLPARYRADDPETQWLTAALIKAHLLGCNPGGEVATLVIDNANPFLGKVPQGVLLDAEMIATLDLTADPPAAHEQ